VVLLSSAALRAHLPANDETRATAALAISTRSICRRAFAEAAPDPA